MHPENVMMQEACRRYVMGFDLYHNEHVPVGQMKAAATNLATPNFHCLTFAMLIRILSCFHLVLIFSRPGWMQNVHLQLKESLPLGGKTTAVEPSWCDRMASQEINLIIEL